MKYAAILIAGLIAAPAIAAPQDDCIKLGITVSQITRFVRDVEEGADVKSEFLRGVNSGPNNAAKRLTLALIAEIKKSDKSAVELSSNAITNCLAGK